MAVEPVLLIYPRFTTLVGEAERTNPFCSILFDLSTFRTVRIPLPRAKRRRRKGRTGGDEAPPAREEA